MRLIAHDCGVARPPYKFNDKIASPAWLLVADEFLRSHAERQITDVFNAHSSSVGPVAVSTEQITPSQLLKPKSQSPLT